MTAVRMIFSSILLFAPQFALAQEPTVLKHDGWVAAVAFAPDGKTLASAGADNVVRLWEVGAWKPKGVLKGHTDCVCALAFSSDGSLFTTGSFDGTAKVWRVHGWILPFTSKKHAGSVLSVWVRSAPLPSPEEFVLITGTLDGALHGWTANHDDIKSSPHKSWVNSLAFHEKAGLASSSSDGTVGLTTLDKENPKLHTLEGGAGEVRSVAFSPDGKLLAAGNRYHTVRVWDVASRKEIKTLDGHMGDVWAISFSPDGKTLATVDTDWKKPSKIRLYDTATWKVRGTLDMPGEILCLAYSPKGDWLAAGSWDKTVRVFAVK